jgi:membrane protease YdiL (CAAX protease family)
VDPGHPAPSPPGSLAAFFVLTFAITWACFIAVAVAVPVATVPGRLLVLLGTFAPGIVAVALAARAGGAGVRTLVEPIARANVPARWYVFAAAWPAGVELAVAVLHRLTGAWPAFSTTPLAVIPFAILLSTPSQAGEEVGWRGWALPRLAARLGLAPASVLLGVIWALWHLPLFFVPGADTFGQSFFVYLINVTAISVAIAWLWERTGRSLLLCMLLHAAVNNSDIVPAARAGAPNVFSFEASRVSWLAAAVLWTCALLFLAAMRRAGTSRHA